MQCRYHKFGRRAIVSVAQSILARSKPIIVRLLHRQKCYGTDSILKIDQYEPISHSCCATNKATLGAITSKLQKQFACESKVLPNLSWDMVCNTVQCHGWLTSTRMTMSTSISRSNQRVENQQVKFSLPRMCSWKFRYLFIASHVKNKMTVEYLRMTWCLLVVGVEKSGLSIMLVDNQERQKD